ncbi:MAG: hypothetical protein SFV21_17280, partial [Rhodospirillaceae bacterium]|nr:hypothetical protein [Rhodospirillaceae bacterium]
LESRSCFTLATQHSTFPMADDGHDEPLRDLAAAREKLSVPEANFRAIMNGEHWMVPAVIRDAENKIVCPSA